MKRKYAHINAQCDAMRTKLAERIADHFATEFPCLAWAALLGMSPAYFAKAIREMRGRSVT